MAQTDILLRLHHSLVPYLIQVLYHVVQPLSSGHYVSSQEVLSFFCESVLAAQGNLAVHGRIVRNKDMILELDLCNPTPSVLVLHNCNNQLSSTPSWSHSTPSLTPSLESTARKRCTWVLTSPLSLHSVGRCLIYQHPAIPFLMTH